MKYTHVVWDFNGTLLDDVETGIRAVNRMLKKRGLPILENADAYRAVFRFPIRDYYAALGFDFTKEPYEVLAPEWVANYCEEEKTGARLHEDAVALLHRLQHEGVKQYLLSATEQGMLEKQLVAWGLRGCFEGVYGLDNIHAHSKESLARSFRAQHTDAVVLMIGDTEHDAEAARAMGADCMLCAKGHQPVCVLQRTGCRVFSAFSELEEAILA